MKWWRGVVVLSLWLVGGSCLAGEIRGKVDLGSLQGGARKVAVRYVGQTGAKADAPPPPTAVVFLAGEFDDATLAAAVKAKGPAEVSQEGFRFRPNILPVVRGATVSFPNLDPDYHNVFSYSKTKRFDLGRYRAEEEAPTITFDEAGPVSLFCEIHKHMRSTVLVLETPHFTTTAADGSYAITDVPAGSYELVAWLNARIQYRQSVTITPGGKLVIDLDAARPAGEEPEKGVATRKVSAP